MSGGGKAREAYGKAGGGGVETGEVDSEDTGLVELLRAHQAVIMSVQGTKNESSLEARKPESPRARILVGMSTWRGTNSHGHPWILWMPCDISIYRASEGRKMYLEST